MAMLAVMVMAMLITRVMARVTRMAMAMVLAMATVTLVAMVMVVLTNEDGGAVGDGLMLADDAADVVEQGLGAGLLGRIRQRPVRRRRGLLRRNRRGDQDKGDRGQQGAPHAAAFRFTPSLSRRSSSDSRPPRAMIAGPRKISRAQGFHQTRTFQAGSSAAVRPRSPSTT